jgi:hypothetical protein
MGGRFPNVWRGKSPLSRLKGRPAGAGYGPRTKQLQAMENISAMPRCSLPGRSVPKAVPRADYLLLDINLTRKARRHETIKHEI